MKWKLLVCFFIVLSGFAGVVAMTPPIRWFDFLILATTLAVNMWGVISVINDEIHARPRQRPERT